MTDYGQLVQLFDAIGVPYEAGEFELYHLQYWDYPHNARKQVEVAGMCFVFDADGGLLGVAEFQGEPLEKARGKENHER